MRINIPDWLIRNISFRPRPRRSPSRWERRLGKAMQALVTIALAIFGIWRVHLHYQITRQFAGIRSAGWPASPQDLNRWYAEVPPASNAAVGLAQAFGLLRTFPDKRVNEIDRARVLDRREDWSAETRARIAEYVAMNSNALAHAQAGLSRPQCRYPVDLTYGFLALYPHLPKLKTLARTAALRAILAAEQGQRTDWPPDIRLMLQLAATLASEPTLISQLTRDSVLAMSVQATERCLNQSGFGNESAELIGAFAGAVNTNAFRLGLIGERASAVPVFRMSWAEMRQGEKAQKAEVTMPKPPPLAGRPNPFLWLTGFLERDLSFFLGVMETNIALAAYRPPASLALTNIAQQFDEIANRNLYIFSQKVLPSIGRAAVRDATTIARIRLAQTALALARYRVVRGELPVDLADLVPRFLAAVPTDPFNGESLRYRRSDQGFIVYSVGADGHDDGGREMPLDAKSSDTYTYDLAFTIEH